MSTLADRYAKAAVEAAVESENSELALNTLADNCEQFAKTFETNTEVRELIFNPSLSNQRSDALQSICQGLGFSQISIGLIKVLSKNERIPEIAMIAKLVRDKANTLLKKLDATVLSAVPLSESQLSRIEGALKKQFGKSIKMNPQVDPEVQGGLIVEVGDYKIDMSVAKELKSLTNKLLKVDLVNK